MCCQCLLKQTRISTFQLSSGSHVYCKQIQPKRSLVTWLITLRLIICPSSYKARPDNLIGTAMSVRRSFLLNRVMPDRTSQPKKLWAGLSSVWYPGYHTLPYLKLEHRHQPGTHIAGPSNKST